MENNNRIVGIKEQIEYKEDILYNRIIGASFSQALYMYS